MTLTPPPTYATRPDGNGLKAGNGPEALVTSAKKSIVYGDSRKKTEQGRGARNSVYMWRAKHIGPGDVATSTPPPPRNCCYER